jgi:hypothetical protein
MCTWHEQLAELVRPLVDAMFQDAYREPHLCVDATGVLVQAKEKCRNAHFWVLVAPEKHVLYGYSRSHDGKAVDKLLQDYKGYLVADAHSVYEHLYQTGDVIEVGCWAHCRRYFFKALESDPDRAKVALSHIGALFRVERTIADAPRKDKERVRRDKILPIVDRFFEWCDAEFPNVLDETPIQDGACVMPETSASPSVASSMTAVSPRTITSVSSTCAGRSSAVETGFLSAATMALSPTPPSSRCSPAHGCTTSSPTATSAICCA